MSSAARTRRRVLALYRHEDPGNMHLAIRQHLRVLDHAEERHDVLYFNAFDGAGEWLRALRFDAVLLHTTFLGMRWHDLFALWKWKVGWLAELDVPKLAFPQDEYDHSEILDEWLYELGVTDIFTNFGRDSRSALYPMMSSRARFHECLTGYVDDSIAHAMQPLLLSPEARPKDIVYRARDLPYWFGSHGQLKKEIAPLVQSESNRRGLRVDISTRIEDTILGPDWLNFLASSRAVIGVESGSSVLDTRGQLQRRVQMLLAQDPDLTFADVAARMPHGWDDGQFFAIGPRHLEAVATKTCQVLVDGSYNGILEPHRHYIPFSADGAGLDEALDRLADPSAVRLLTKTAYDDLVASGAYSYRAFARQIETVLLDHPASSRQARWRPAAAFRLASRANAMAPLGLTGTARRRLTLPLLGRTLRQPRLYTRLARIVVTEVRRSPQLSALVRCYRTDAEARREVRWPALQSDLLRLIAIERASAEEAADMSLETTVEDARLWLRARRNAASAPTDRFDGLDAEVKSVALDWSELGGTIPLRDHGRELGVVSVGERGIAELPALSVLVRRHPQIVVRALTALVARPATELARGRSHAA